MLLKLSKYCLTIWLLLFLCNCKEETKPKNAGYWIGNDFFIDESNDQLVQQIRSYNRYEGAIIGFTGVPSMQYKRFQKLCSRISDEELLKLVNDTNAVMRCYAFKGLVERNVMYMQDVLKEHLDDTAFLESQSGCISMPLHVNDAFVSIASSCLDGNAIAKYRALIKDKSIFRLVE